MGIAAIGAGAALALGGGLAIGTVATAVAAGTVAALSVGTVFTAIATVGAVVGAVGAVTGNKDLQMAGMVVGGIGGIGGLAASVGAFGGSAASVGSIFGSSASTAAAAAPVAAATDAAATGGGLVGAGVDAAGSEAAAATGGIESVTVTANAANDFSPAMINAINSGGGDAAIAAAANPTTTGGPATDPTAAVVQPSGAASTPPSTTSGTPATASPIASDPALNPVQVTPGTPVASDIPTGDLNAFRSAYPGGVITPNTIFKAPSGAVYTANGTTLTPQSAAGGIGGLLGSLSNMSEGSGLLAMGVVQSAGSFLSGATSKLTPAQVVAYQAQANANNASAALTQQQVSNMNSGMPTAKRLAVTGSTGMMNSTPPNPTSYVPGATAT